MDIQERVKRIYDDSGLSLADFSFKIDESKSKVVHVLSGRNKPSLDFLLSVCDGFPEVDKLWLLTGEKSKQETKVVVQEKVIEKVVEKEVEIEKKTDLIERKLISVIKFYSDGTFEEFRSDKG